MLFKQLILFLFLFLIGCNPVNKTSKKNNKSEVIDFSSQSNFDLSPNTKFFLKDLDELLKKSELKDIKLPQNFTDKYSIKEIDNNYWVTGFIKINSDFDTTKFGDNNFNFKKNGNISSINFKLTQLHIFLKSDGIEYFSISEKAHLNKSHYENN